MKREEAIKNLIDHKTEFTNDFGWNTSVIESLEMAIKALVQEPSNDMVSRGVFEQVMWERDVAIEQLKDLGYGLGEKPKTGHWIKKDGYSDCSECGSHIVTEWDYCPNCGAEMKEGK